MDKKERAVIYLILLALFVLLLTRLGFALAIAEIIWFAHVVLVFFVVLGEAKRDALKDGVGICIAAHLAGRDPWQDADDFLKRPKRST